jgi:hypothetical protein
MALSARLPHGKVIIKSRVRTRDKKIAEGKQIDFELRFKVPSIHCKAYMITEVFPPNETKTNGDFKEL